MEKILQEWIKTNQTFGIKLPNGWFGRPFDNQHELTWYEDRKFKLLVEIAEQLLFIITKTKQFEIFVENNDLVIKNFLRVTFDRLGYGDLTPHTETFDIGELRLISYQH